MEEQNKKTLIEALSSLPEHEPKDELWSLIEDDLDLHFDRVVPKKLLQALPQHEPPDEVWMGILRKMEVQLPVPGTAKILQLGWRRALAAAASVAVLVMAGWYIMQSLRQTVPPAIVEVRYSVEAIDPLLMQHDWEEDEAMFTEFLGLCEAKKSVCEQPEFKQLQGELDELTAAKAELQTAIGEFGTNAELVLQIKEIELERTGLVKKMMAMLI